MIDVPANDKRRRILKNQFKVITGLDPIIEFSKEFMTKNPRGYLAKYTHFLEQAVISQGVELTNIKKQLKK